MTWVALCLLSGPASSNGILIWMSGKGYFKDKTMVETFFKSLKSEPIWRIIYQTHNQAEIANAPYIDGFHNPTRRHSAPGYISPAQFERRAA